ncbi:MAG: hypothetical protein ACMUJM_09960 [bacterium]
MKKAGYIIILLISILLLSSFNIEAQLFTSYTTNPSSPFIVNNRWTVSPLFSQVSLSSIWEPYSSIFSQRPIYITPWSPSSSWGQDFFPSFVNTPLAIPDYQFQWASPALYFPWIFPLGPTSSETLEPAIKEYSNSDCNPTTREEKHSQFSYLYEHDILYLYHKDALFNCCIIEIARSMEIVDHTINIYEEELLDGSGCRCVCNYDLTTLIENLPSGTYSAQFFNKKSGEFLGEIPQIIIP